MRIYNRLVGYSKHCMQLNNRIFAFSILGKFLSQFGSSEFLKLEDVPYNDTFFDSMKDQFQLAKNHNGWFTDENLQFACQCWSETLLEKNLKKWLSGYTINDSSGLTVALIMAGNIPLVGFHDFISVLITGHKALIKLSSSDKYLLPFLAKYLIAVEQGFEDYIIFTDEKLTDFNAVITTGSNNTARYFNYYFGKYPNIIRKNRNSVAVLTGNETQTQLEGLADDIFRYFGLGCRNVSKLYVPEGYNFDSFFNAMFKWKQVINQNKYMNNYDYNKTVYLMSNIKLLDNEFLLLKEDINLSSPISVIYYETYNTITRVDKKISKESESIQCIVAEANIKNEIGFGNTQKPQIWDYADGINTIDFLLKLPK